MMKFSLVLSYLIVLIVGLGSACCSAASETQNKTSIADLTVTIVDSEATRLDAIQKNKPLYIKFWASWCASCLKEMPKLAEDFKKYGDKIQFLTVNVGIEDTQEDIKRIYREYGLEMPAAIDSDGTLGQTLGFVGTPYHLLFDRDWKLMHKGHSADDQLSLTLSVLAGNPVQKAELKEKHLVEVSALQSPGFTLQEDGVVFYTIAWCDWYMLDTNKSLAERCKKVSQNIARLKKERPELKIKILVSPMWISDEEIKNYKQRFALKVPVFVDTGDVISRQYGLRNVGMALVFKSGSLKEKVVGVDDYNRLKNVGF
ncbi:MAG: TlpA disulfide reductase family protein [Pseudomonadota bacterium]